MLPDDPGSRKLVSLTVETSNIASLRRHARHSAAVRVGTGTGWCLRYATTSVAVPLAAGRVLHVTGTCRAAARFAARAIPRLGS